MALVSTASVYTATMANLNKVWEEVLHYATLHTYPQGHALVLQGAFQKDFYYLQSGRISILHGAQNGKVQNMLYLEAGNLFHVADVIGKPLTDFVATGCQFFCLQESAVWRFPGKLLHDQVFIQENPALMSNLLASLGVKLLIMHNTLSNAGTGSTLTNICRFALNLSQANENARRLSPNLSQNELANLFGVHRATLLRAMQTLKKLGVISKLTRDELIIDDMEQLRDLAGD